MFLGSPRDSWWQRHRRDLFLSATIYLLLVELAVCYSALQSSTSLLSRSADFPLMASSSAAENGTPRWDPDLQIYVGGVVPGASNEDIQAMLEKSNGTLRVFGYGSLCWNPGSPDTALGNPSVQATMGHAVGYRRIWGQKSTDHRGVPSFPGVVCTLLTTQEVQEIRGASDKVDEEKSSSSSPSSTEGMIYSVPPSLAQQCLEELDFREKGGYAREIIDVVDDKTGNQVQALLYRGTPDNPAFSSRLTTDLRYASAVMAVANGPSGPNHVYLHQLDEFLIKAKEELQHQHRKAENDDDNVIEDDTYLLADMTTALQKHGLYFFCGAGSNQHGQTVNYLEEDQDFATLTESFVAIDSNSESGIVDRPKQLFCGGGHSGLVTDQGSLYVWGWNQHGQCGREEKDRKIVAVNDTQHSSGRQSSFIPLLQPLSISVETAAFGFSHTLVIEKGTGKLYAFGDDSHGQVTGRNADSSNFGSNVSNESTVNDVFQPVAPLFLDNEDESFVSVGAGLFHSAAITVGGELITFGHSKYGQANTDGQRWKPDGAKLVDVACGRHHTAMLDDRGRIWTMGENKFGQLGRPNESSYGDDSMPDSKLQRQRTKNMDPTPQLVDGPFGKEQGFTKNTIHRCVELQSGWSHIVARVEFEKLANGDKSIELYGWGRSDKGQLGLQQKVVPCATKIDIGNGLGENSVYKAVSIACGSDSSHLLTQSRSGFEIFSVGWNEHGNLGIGQIEQQKDDEDVFEARRVQSFSRIVSPATYSTSGQSQILLAAGGAHMLAMRV